MRIVIVGPKGSAKTPLKLHISAEMDIPCVDVPLKGGPWVVETREWDLLPEWSMKFGPLEVLYLDREDNPDRKNVPRPGFPGIRCLLRRQGTARSMATALRRYWNSTYVQVLRAVESDVINSNIEHNARVIDSSYGWTVYSDKKMAGLTAGDHGFLETSLEAPEIYREEDNDDLYTGLQCFRLGTDIVWMDFEKETR